jgi:hypothetical protein
VYEITDPVIKEFLDSIERPSTKNCYKTFLSKYLEWSGKTGQQLIEEKKATLRMEKLKNHYSILESGFLTARRAQTMQALLWVSRRFLSPQ